MHENVTHGLPAFYREDSEILILGTMPSVSSRQAGFYYMHPQNRFWRALSDALGEPPAHSTEDKKELLIRNRIALFDVLKSCDISGSSDSSIKNPVPNDISGLINKTQIKRVLVTGKTAERLYKRYCEADTGIPAGYLPSPSPANCALPYEKLAEAYRLQLSTPIK